MTSPQYIVITNSNKSSTSNNPHSSFYSLNTTSSGISPISIPPTMSFQFSLCFCSNISPLLFSMTTPTSIAIIAACPISCLNDFICPPLLLYYSLYPIVFPYVK